MATGQAAVDALTTSLADQEEQVRFLAANGLALIGPRARSAAGALKIALADSSERVRWEAASALARLKAEGRVAVPFLLGGLEHKEPARQYEAVIGLGEIGPEAKAAVPGLLALLARDKDMAPYIFDTLGKIGPEARAAITPLRTVLQGKQRGHIEVALALWRIDPDNGASIPHLIEALGDEKEAWPAAAALGEIGPAAKAAISALMKLLKRDDQTAEAAAEALGSLGADARPALPLLSGKLQDKSPRFRAKATVAMARIASVTPEQLHLLQAMGKHADFEVRFAAVHGLGLLGKAAEASVPTLIQVLWDREDSIRRAAAEALEQIDPDAAANAGVR
jgi:HEAT repeat protein